MYREMMSLLDRDNGGIVTADELGSCFSTFFGWRPTKYECKKMVETVDRNGSGQICLREFIMMCTHEIKGNPALQKVYPNHSILAMNHLTRTYAASGQASTTGTPQ